MSTRHHCRMKWNIFDDMNKPMMWFALLIMTNEVISLMSLSISSIYDLTDSPFSRTLSKAFSTSLPLSCSRTVFPLSLRSRTSADRSLFRRKRPIAVCPPFYNLDIPCRGLFATAHPVENFLVVKWHDRRRDCEAANIFRHRGLTFSAAFNSQCFDNPKRHLPSVPTHPLSYWCNISSYNSVFYHKVMFYSTLRLKILF